MAKLRVTQVKSTIDRPKRQKATMQALGLKKVNGSIEIDNPSPQVMGMLNKVAHLVKIEEV